MSLYIYIDDTRKPIFTDCIWAKDYEGAITAVENNAKDNHLIIDFDHDLGTEKTGYDLAKWLEAPFLRSGLKSFRVKIKNGSGRDRGQFRGRVVFPR